MIQYLYDRDIIIYTYAGLCGLGLFFRLIVNLVYKRLIKQSDNLGETKNKLLKHIKMKFETCYKLKIGVNNVDTFVDKSVYKYRFCGLLLSTWENLCGQVLYLNLLTVPILAIFGVIYDCGQEVVLFTGVIGLSTSALMILVDKSINISAKKRIIRINLLDYLENFCKARMEQEALYPELTSQLRRELVQTVEAGKQISAASGPLQEKMEVKSELERRREARLKKEEEKRLAALKKEEEQKRAELARKEEERRKLEEKKLAAARRREEERLRLEEERLALEARREELRRKAQERRQALESKKQTNEQEPVLHAMEDKHHVEEGKSDLEMLMEGLEEIAAERERANFVKAEKDKPDMVIQDKLKEPEYQAESNAKKKATGARTKSSAISLQEEKLIEDVLREFFA